MSHTGLNYDNIVADFYHSMSKSVKKKMRCQAAIDNGLIGPGGEDFNNVCPPM